MTKGIIYVLTNPGMDGLVKIGRTTDRVEPRMKELFSTGVPYPFRCEMAVVVTDAAKVEKKLHDAFGDHRISPNREFFKIDWNRVKAVLELLMIEEVTPRESDSDPELGQYQDRQLPFRFSLANVPIGADLVFARDESITCKVTGDKSVEFRGEITSLSAAASVLLRERGRNSTQVQGPLYWLYEGESLAERRQKIEEGA